jgi:hypothetical protein
VYPNEMVHQGGSPPELNLVSLLAGLDSEGGCEMSFPRSNVAVEDQILSILNERE